MPPSVPPIRLRSCIAIITAPISAAVSSRPTTSSGRTNSRHQRVADLRTVASGCARRSPLAITALLAIAHDQHAEHQPRQRRRPPTSRGETIGCAAARRRASAGWRTRSGSPPRRHRPEFARTRRIARPVADKRRQSGERHRQRQRAMHQVAQAHRRHRGGDGQRGNDGE